MSDLTQTHYYDHTPLGDPRRMPFYQEYRRAASLPPEVVANILQALNDFAGWDVYPQARNHLRKLIADRNTPRNWDAVHHLDISILLVLCYHRLISHKNPHFIKSLAQQLQEMKSGDCSQGRSVRLYQILCSYHA
jgi:hypothetical protein